MATKAHPSNLNSNPNSLCDLPIYGDDTKYITTSMKGEESFRFFSEEWVKNNKDLNIFPNKDILFCGKLIVPKQPVSNNTQEIKKRENRSTKVDVNSGYNNRDREFAKLISMNKGRNNHDGERKTNKAFPSSSGSHKSRWYYYGLKLAGFHVEMDMSAIKTRRNQHQKSHGKEGSGGSRHGKGLGRLIRDLSCDGPNQANLMVEASHVSIPKV